MDQDVIGQLILFSLEKKFSKRIFFFFFFAYFFSVLNAAMFWEEE